MARLFTFIFMTVGLMILFSYLGFDTTSSYVLNQIGLIDNPGDYENTGFHSGLMTLGIVALLGTAAIVFGSFISGGNLTIIISASIAYNILAVFITDFIAVVQYARVSAGWTSYLIILICAPVIVGYSISLFDWVRGND